MGQDNLSGARAKMRLTGMDHPNRYTLMSGGMPYQPHPKAPARQMQVSAPALSTLGSHAMPGPGLGSVLTWCFISCVAAAGAPAQVRHACRYRWPVPHERQRPQRRRPVQLPQVPRVLLQQAGTQHNRPPSPYPSHAKQPSLYPSSADSRAFLSALRLQRLGWHTRRNECPGTPPTAPLPSSLAPPPSAPPALQLLASTSMQEMSMQSMPPQSMAHRHTDDDNMAGRAGTG